MRDIMNMKNQGDKGRDGVALIICLGLLSVMTLMAVTFSISMRIERVAAGNFADSVQAKHLIHTALVRAMEAIDDDLVPSDHDLTTVYPQWDVLTSQGGTAARIVTAAGLEPVPNGPILTAAQAATPTWINVGSSTFTGRVAFVAMNLSGLLDLNHHVNTNYLYITINQTGAQRRVWGTNVFELDLSFLPEFSSSYSVTDFASNRNDIVRYETLGELETLDPHFQTAFENFMTFSFDLSRDQLFLTIPNAPTPGWWDSIDESPIPAMLGRRGADDFLHDKFYINSITNYAAYHDRGDPDSYKDDAQFRTHYYAALWKILDVADIERPDDVAWNIINYLDPDRIPQSVNYSDLSGFNDPWVHSEGGEAIPMVNEIVLSPTNIGSKVVNTWTPPNAWPPGHPSHIPGHWTSATNAAGTGYVFNVEIWYPFAPINVSTGDNFYLQVWVYDDLAAQPPAQGTHHGPNAYVITNETYINTNWSFSVAITNMQFGTDTEYIVVRSPTNKVITFGGGTNLITDASVLPIYFLARVVKGEHNPTDGYSIQIVDEGMGYDGGDNRDRRKLMPFKDTVGYSVMDPRSNGQRKYWLDTANGGTGAYPWDATNTASPWSSRPHQTLGYMNTRTDPFNSKGHGVPIYAKNGTMRNMGEIGHIWRSNLDDEEPNIRDWYWRNINLMNADEGAKLMDLMTVQESSSSRRGLISINSRDEDVIRALFHGMRVGVTNDGFPSVRRQAVSNNMIDEVVEKILEVNDVPFVSYADMFPTDEVNDRGAGGGELGEAFQNCGNFNDSGDTDDDPDLYMEDAFRLMAELITFRQNIFVIIMGAQALSPTGKVLSERRAVATVYRDAYTGHRYTQNFKWIDAD